MQQKISWLGFIVSNALTRTIVHFYPASSIASAPYPAECKLTIFGQGIDQKSVVLEGARFGQPDGVRLDEAFSSLRDGTVGIYGLIIEISTIQPRVDVQGSSCLIEFSSGGQTCRYIPAPLGAHSAAQQLGIDAHGAIPALMIKDALNTTGLVAVNCSDDSSTPCVKINDLKSKELISLNLSNTTGNSMSANQPAVLPHTVQEIELPSSIFNDCEPTECSWGLVRSRSILLDNQNENVRYYMIMRDALTRRPVSVQSLHQFALTEGK